jgi:hypothetical protein
VRNGGWGIDIEAAAAPTNPQAYARRIQGNLLGVQTDGVAAANPLGTVAAVGFALAIVASVVHLSFKVPMPELVLDDREWKRARWGAVLLFGLNYAWVIFAHTTLHWR